MVVKAWLSAILIAVAFDVVAQPVPPTPTKKCKKTDPSCEISVTVPVPCSSCILSVDHSAVEIEPGNNNNIAWRITTPGYAFDKAKGIYFPADPREEVFKCHPERNASLYVCSNKHEKSGDFKYTVNVTGPGAPKPLDPWVVNR
jgi:hypothetical protein